MPTMAMRMAPPTPPPATLLRMVVRSSEPPPAAAVSHYGLEERSAQATTDNSGDGISHGSQTVIFHGCTRHVAPDCTADRFDNEADDVHRFGFLFCSCLLAFAGPRMGQRKKRRRLPEMVWLLPRNDRPPAPDIHLRPNESGTARPQCLLACIERHAAFRLSFTPKNDK